MSPPGPTQAQAKRGGPSGAVPAFRAPPLAGPLPPRARLTAIQFLRFVAAMMVVVFHANIFADIHHPRPASDAMMMFASIGKAGVPVFFVISGFIMLHTSRSEFAQPGASPRFLRRRLVRIFPIYWIVLLFYLATGEIAGAFDPATAGAADWLGVFLLLPGYADLVVSPAWTLVYELYFYIVFGALLVLPLRAALVAITAVLMGGVVLGEAGVVAADTPVLHMMTNPVLLEFLAGVAIGWIAATPTLLARLKSPLLLHALWLLSLVGFVLIPFLDTQIPRVALLGIPSVLIVAWAVLAECMDRVPRLIDRLAWLGDSSYSLYLIHIAVMAVAMPVVWKGADHAIILQLSLLSFVAGLALHVWVERPVQRLLRSGFARARAR